MEREMDCKPADVAVAVMARSPVAGPPPKTRLASVVPDSVDRRRVYAAFLQDTIRACRSLDGTALRVAHTPDGGDAGIAECGAARDELMVQRGADLGQRERAVFGDLFAAGFSKVILIGSDLPTLPVAYLRAAIDRTADGNVVLGPAVDGGYYLMALARKSAEPLGVPDLFTGVRWSHPRTLADTQTAAARCGLRVELLPAWYDVDDAAGALRLREDLANARGRRRAPATAAILAQVTAEPAGAPTSPGGQSWPCAS